MHSCSTLPLSAISYITAIAGSDYMSISSEAVFSTGSTNNDARCENVSLLQDNALEGDQIFTVILTTSDPDVMIQTNMTSVTILDNDGNKPAGRLPMELHVCTMYVKILRLGGKMPASIEIQTLFSQAHCGVIFSFSSSN